MILVDTNVVSEVMKAAPDRSVLQWLNAASSTQLYISSVTIGEIQFGLNILPDGKRRSGLKQRFERFVEQGFSHRVVAYGEAAANEYGELMAQRRRIGRPMSMPDGQIAAIAKAERMQIATRNVRDFEACDVDLVNPFTGSN